MSVAVVLTLNFDTTLGNVAAAASTTLAVYPTSITVALAELALAVAGGGGDGGGGGGGERMWWRTDEEEEKVLYFRGKHQKKNSNKEKK